MQTNDAATGKDYGDEPDTLNQHWYEPGDPDGVVAAERERVWREGHPQIDMRKVHADIRKRYWRPVVIAAVAVVLLIVGAYFLGFRRAALPLAQQLQTAKNKSERKLVPATVSIKHYTNADHTLGFDFPDNWVVAETKGKLTITSPNYRMQTNTGQTDNGHVVVTMQDQQTSIPGYPDGGAMASLASTQLNYTKPSDVQRKQTYLTYAGYTDSSGIDALYLTGDSQYQPGDKVGMADVVRGAPLISVGFVKCTKSYCSGGTSNPVTLRADSWGSAPFKAPVTKLLQSLVLQ